MYDARYCAGCAPNYMLNHAGNTCVAYPATSDDAGYDANCEEY